MKHKFIVIEGVDGTGKSTVASLLAKMLGAKTVKTPLPPMLEQRRYYDEEVPPLARFLFYLNGNVVVSDLVRQLLASTDVVCDRYLESTICFHKAMGVDTNFVDFTKIPILKPDYCFCLQADEPVRISRIASRGVSSDTDGKLELLRAADQLLARHCPNVIDTTYLTAEEVASMIYGIIT
jgi:dTMP kinase